MYTRIPVAQCSGARATEVGVQGSRQIRDFFLCLSDAANIPLRVALQLCAWMGSCEFFARQVWSPDLCRPVRVFFYFEFQCNQAAGSDQSATTPVRVSDSSVSRIRSPGHSEKLLARSPIAGDVFRR